MRAWAVSELAGYVRQLLEDDPALQDVWLAGEISNFARSAPGHIYFTLKDAEAALSCVAWRNVAARLAWQPALERLVADVLATPLDETGLKLADIPRTERLVELEFAFPLGSPAAQAGYMKGFIDLVFRHAGRWYIVDWKSNWLGTQAVDYALPALEAAMRQHRYDVQLRIYAAALKRALALREPESGWESSFGGVFYLFLRGMGPGGNNGIHFSRPTVDEIEAFLEGTTT